MFNKPVVFIVGAGASKDYSLPLGGQLASTIAKDVENIDESTNGDTNLYNTLSSIYGHESIPKYVAAGRELAKILPSSVSIDAALNHLSDYPEAVDLGKICIIREILAAERRCPLHLRPETRNDGWIEELFSMAIDGPKRADLPGAFGKVTIINFNYDRRLEHYLYWSLQRIGLSVQEATAIVSKLSIIRPYGTIGSILPEAPDFVQFGAAAERVNVPHAIKRIRTYTESPLHDPKTIRTAMASAAMYVFLGFGFHRQNLELLSVLEVMPVRSDRTDILATVVGVDRAIIDGLRRSLEATVKVHFDRIVPLDKTATQMLRDLRLGIMMAVG
jgi:hypothetical protein